MFLKKCMRSGALAGKPLVVDVLPEQPGSPTAAELAKPNWHPPVLLTVNPSRLRKRDLKLPEDSRTG